jgi:tetratricopeptide (TPR) repeat protein
VNQTPSESRSEQTKGISLALVVVLGLVCAVATVRWIDTRRPTGDLSVEDESLYLSGTTARRMSMAFNGLAADWYWMRSLQYVGRKILRRPDNVELDDLQTLNLKVLAPLLDTATTLDPQFMDPYEYAAVVLPAVDVQEAIRITRKGIDANPTAWRLYQHLGYIYWQQRDYQAAGETYGRGASLPGAPPWMQAMKAKMETEGGSRSTAREIYTQMFEESTDNKVKDMARRRLMQLDSLDERDALRKIFELYKARIGHCPASWKEVEPVLKNLRVPVNSSGSPFDPSGKPYVLKKETCDVELDPNSDVPAR